MNGRNLMQYRFVSIDESLGDDEVAVTLYRKPSWIQRLMRLQRECDAFLANTTLGRVPMATPSPAKSARCSAIYGGVQIVAMWVQLDDRLEFPVTIPTS